MSDERVYFAADVSQETLIGWLEASFKGKAYRLGMRPDDTDLSEFDSQQVAHEVSAWPQGRVFGRTREVRWEQLGDDAYAVWVLGEPLSNMTGFDRISKEGWTTNQGRPGLYLWGRFDRQWTEERTDDEIPTWIEVRIPRPLHYPVTPPPENEREVEALFARLGHIEYCAPNGAVQFTQLITRTCTQGNP